VAGQWSCRALHSWPPRCQMSRPSAPAASSSPGPASGWGADRKNTAERRGPVVGGGDIHSPERAWCAVDADSGSVSGVVLPYSAPHPQQRATASARDSEALVAPARVGRVPSGPTIGRLHAHAMPLSETSPSSSGAFSKGAWGAAGGLSSRQTRDDLRKSKEGHFHAGVEAPPRAASPIASALQAGREGPGWLQGPFRLAKCPQSNNDSAGRWDASGERDARTAGRAWGGPRMPLLTGWRESEGSADPAQPGCAERRESP
jgi:hypothetical protein